MTNPSQPGVIPASLERLVDAALVGLAEYSTDCIVMASFQGQVLFVNPAGQQMVGLDGPEQVQGTDILDYAVEGERGRWQTEILPTVMRQGHWGGELHLRHFKTGAPISLLPHIFSIKDAQSQQPLAFALISRCPSLVCTPAEAALRASEERWRTVFEHAAIGIGVVDAEGRSIGRNPAFQRFLGYTAEELRQMSFLEFTHPEDAGKDWALHSEVFAGTRDHYQIEKRYITKEGQVRWGYLTVSAIHAANGVCQFVVGMVEDITERKQAEAELRATSAQLRALMAGLRSAREQEGARIAREIHDELGSALTSLRWDIEEIDTTIAEAVDLSGVPRLRGKIGAMGSLIDTTIHIVRRIAAELRPSVLDNLGLAAALEWQAQQFQARTGIMCRYNGAGEHLVLDQERATAIFRIFQEALTNVLRHAQATRVDVMLEEKGPALLLTIRDNGRGITEDESSGLHSLGLLGMRERAHLLGGRLDIIGTKGQGTTVILCVPYSGGARVDRSDIPETPWLSSPAQPGVAQRSEL
jgi:PAS domain S-box-containing protein